MNDFFFLRRQMTALRKLPIIRPNKKMEIYKKIIAELIICYYYFIKKKTFLQSPALYFRPMADKGVKILVIRIVIKLDPFYKSLLRGRILPSLKQKSGF